MFLPPFLLVPLTCSQVICWLFFDVINIIFLSSFELPCLDTSISRYGGLHGYGLTCRLPTMTHSIWINRWSVLPLSGRHFSVFCPLPNLNHCRFKPAIVKNCIREIMRERLSGMRYDPEEVPQLTSSLAESIKDKVKGIFSHLNFFDMHIY